MSSEYINTEIANYLVNNTALTADERNAIQQASAAGLGALIGASLGGNSTEVKQSAQMALRTEKFNRQLHPEEKQRIKDLAKGDKEKEARLTVAACALVHCSAQIPEDSPEYAKAKALEELGNTSEYASERALLSKQTAYIGHDAFAAGAEKPLFNYNKVYQAKDYDDANLQVMTRAGGLAQATGGVAATALGVGMCETGLGCVGGVPVAAYGVDNAVAGARTVYSGKYVSTLGAKALSELTGMSSEVAEFIYGVPAVASGSVNLAKGAGKVMNVAGKQMAASTAEAKYVATELGKDVKIMGSYLNDEAIKFGVNVQNSQTLTNINNTIPREYKIAFGINAITGGAVESLYYIDGSKNITKDNLASSTIKVGTNAVYDSLVHKLNPIYGAIADTVKGVAIDNNNIEKSILNAGKSASSSSVIDYTGSKIGLNDISTKGISSSYNKYLDYLNDKKEQKEEVK
ncbi:hypothetical protein OQ257_01935 [Actinobacillus equuli subsp. equuli]|uniref:Uncharacterized protein n=1 Tax=Actinobacillus equuli subsp. equuli TaxID=202947 RepID=A0A9X4G286_ACTEU|nr:hypothetical protein [Actinobacillus equuli]MDE8033932.1 hypothetical protein [Actinobacillus equuli subsp. equuli]MDG4948025.1 hypothetical protein [Actinobacillus equuli subsp. haemolyticus]